VYINDPNYGELRLGLTATMFLKPTSKALARRPLFSGLCKRLIEEGDRDGIVLEVS
jgi:hypothetical protein